MDNIRQYIASGLCRRRFGRGACASEVRRRGFGRSAALFVATLALGLASLHPAAAESAIRGRFRALPAVGGWLTSVFKIVQTEDGFLWLGSSDGLVRYDGYGYRTYRHSDSDSTSLCHNMVNALYLDSASGLLYVGTDEGACVYDASRDCFERVKQCGKRHVKAFAMDGENLLVGTTTGLLKLLEDGSVQIFTAARSGLPSDHIASILNTGTDIWLGSYDHLYRMRDDGGFDIHRISDVFGGRNILILDIVQDPGRDGPAGGPGSGLEETLWIGTEAGMLNYDPRDGSQRTYLQNVPVKDFYFLGDNLWVGTDYGLYVMSADGTFSNYRHESGNSNSLPDNVIWCIYGDAAGNVWIGTDHGVTMTEGMMKSRFLDVGKMTGSTEGLDVGEIASDGEILWLGGRNGLIKYNLKTGAGRWYKSDSGPLDEQLSHNKVRALYDDGKNLWIASDGGLDCLSAATGKIRHFRLVEPTGRYSSNWMYAVREDRYGRLWAGTYDGGLYVIDKKKLLAGGSEAVCDRHFSSISSPAISSDVVRKIAIAQEYVAASEGNNIIDIIRLDDMSLSTVSLASGESVSSLLADGDSVWVGTDRGVYVLSGGGIRSVSDMDMKVASMMECGDEICAICSGSLFFLNALSGEWTRIPVGDMLQSGVCVGTTMFFGTTDGVVEFDRSAFTGNVPAPEVAITGLIFNNETVEVGREYFSDVVLPRSIGCMDKIVLPHRMNTFSVEFTSFDFGVDRGGYAYRLKGFASGWQETTPGEHRAVFTNVPRGKYVFEVAASLPEQAGYGKVTSLGIKVRPAWYASTVAYIFYFLVVAGLILWFFYYLRMKAQLRNEQAERERALKAADMKTEFLANVSHEFKSPLSIILNLVGKMAGSEPDALRASELQTVRNNAEKIHLLLNQVVEFNDNSSTSLFIPTATSLVELVRSVYDRYETAFREKNISSRFVSDEIDYVFSVDRAGMETVVQNLLSNALKFTPDGGSVLVSVTVGEETAHMVYADIRVENTGIGIREEELPLIFNRYYRAPSNQQDNPDGSGIGLALVKQIVEQHKGKVKATSEPGKTTAFTVRLSTLKADSFLLKPSEEEEVTLHNLSNVWQHERKPIILLVEDNVDVRDLITASLGKDYDFLVADEGQQGLDLIAKEKIDLVITDLTLPGMDGLTMSKSIRNSLNTSFLPIIILTGKVDMETQMRSLDYADAFIPKPFSIKFLNNRIIQLLIKHEQYLAKMRQVQILEPEVEDSGQSFDEKLLQEVMGIVSRHIEDPEFSASALCNESRYSNKQIYRKIKQLTGMSIVEFIRDTRLRKAASLLSQGKLTVTEVMYKVGFTTASYFAKCFKQKFGVTPSEYK